MEKLMLVLCAAVGLAAQAVPVEWRFPLTESCHQGMAFADGRTGVLVWGGGDTINLTVGRADLWDHRGGYPWTAEQSYTNIVAAVRSCDKDRLYGLFSKETPAGEPRNPYMLPLGRVVVKLGTGATLSRGELDPFTGLGKLHLADGRTIEIAMGKSCGGLFAMKFADGLEFEVALRHCMEFPAAKSALEKVGFSPAEPGDGKWSGGRGGGFAWQVPADRPAGLRWREKDGTLVVRSDREGAAFAWSGPEPTFEAVRDESIAYWKAFWEKGARVKGPDPVIQRIFDYGMYRFGAMTDPDGIPAGLQGPWLEDDKLVPWNGDYHFNINVQECYSPAYRGGHFENLMPLFKMVLSWRPLLRDNAKKFAQIDNGYVLPHSVDDRGVCIGGFWTGTIDHASTAWVAAMMMKYVRYSGDIEFLKNDACDFMKGAMNVYRAMMEEKDGRLSIPLGPSPEWGAADVRHAVGRDPSFQLAAAHRLARDLIEAAKLLGEEPDPMWLDVERRLPAFTAGPGGIQLFEGQPFVETHRHHSHMAGLYPFDTIDVNANRGVVYDTYSTWQLRGTGMWTGWCVPWASILNLHAGNDRAAVELLRCWDAYYCDEGHGSHHNAVNPGFTQWNGGMGVMQMDGACAAVTAVMELMAHEVNGKVEFFRGCPPAWTDVSFENLALSDGRRVNGRRVNGRVEISDVAPVPAADRVSLNGKWTFSLDGGPARTVVVPHDWTIEAAPSPDGASENHGGYYPCGVGVYERTFALTESDLKRELVLEFDGVFRSATVEVNGRKVGRGPFYGYTGFEVPLAADSVRAGDNTLRVTADLSTPVASRWFTGAGIYRNVWLRKWEAGRRVADIAVATSADGTVTVSGTVGGRPERLVRKVENPVLWTPETPKLYDFDFFGERIRVGIRTIGWDADRGFLLNGKPLKLHGACAHHDHGPLGSAAPDAAEVRKVRLLKRAGFNAVRTSHNPVSEAFLDACDAEGLLVIDDMFDGWRKSKTNGDYGNRYAEDWNRDLSWTVRRDRRHASVAMWSIGNEIFESLTEQAVADARAMAARCRELDPSRPVTMALCCWGDEEMWHKEDNLAAQLDIVGYNYLEDWTEKDRERVPGRIIVYTETYPRNAVDVWRRIQRHGYVVGEFVWTGLDYLGEASIGRAYYAGKDPAGEHWEIKPAYPWHGACCGDVDFTGWRKAISHQRETLWNPQAPTTLFVREPDGWRGEIRTTKWGTWPTWPEWTFSGWEGRPVTAEVYSRADRVRLTLNGKAVGERTNGPENGWTTTFELDYAPGELVAEGLSPSGEVLDRSVLRTAGEPTGVRYTRETIGELTWVVAELVDANGTVCPDADREVAFEGEVLATCSGDLRDSVPAPSRTRRTWHGRAMAVIRETPSR